MVNMIDSSRRHHRRSIRLPGFDYTQQGAYFVTICSSGRECLFGEIHSGEMHLNTWGGMVSLCWQDIPRHFPSVDLDAFVVMPNHVHGILVLAETVGATHASPLPKDTSVHPRGPTPQSVAAIVGSLKAAVTKRVNENRSTRGQRVWQRNYYEHVIRDEEDYYVIRQYIGHNPQRWVEDENYPRKPGATP